MFMMWKNQPINEQKHAVSAASGGPYDKGPLLTELTTKAGSLTFIFE